MRLFLAIDLPAKVREQIFSQTKDLRKDYPDGDWTEPHNYHITVHFFGEVTRVDSIKKRVEEVVYDFDSFYLYTQGVDLFMKNKITLYTTFLRQKKLEEMVQGIREKFAHEVIDTRTFVPHLTIGRYRIPSKQQYFALQKRIQRISIDAEFEVKRLVLFESDLSGKRPVYNEVLSFPLAEKAS